MSNIPQLIDEIHRRRVERARRMTPDEKFEAGERLFLMACEVTKAGIRDAYPEMSDVEVLSILRQRLALRRKVEESQWTNAKPLIK